MIREINSIVISDPKQTLDVCEQALAFSATWGKADQVHRHAILKEMFDAIFIDANHKTIVGVKPYAEFVPMFRQTKLAECDGMFVLKNEEAAQDGSSTE